MQTAKDAIVASKAPMIVGHVSPDADCIAGILVMYSVLKSQGKSAIMILPRNTVAEKFRFMFDLVDPGPELGPDEPSDLVIAVDTALRNRINLPEGSELSPDVPVCNIDHHLGNERYGRFNWVDPEATSTTQMIFLILKSLGVSLTAEQAGLLYAGLHGDSCGFSLRGTSVAALNVAAELAALGPDIGAICQKMHRSMPVNEFKLMQLVYANTQISSSGLIAWSTISGADLAHAGCGPDDIDEQVSVPRSIDGVKIAILFSERKPGLVRMNIRSEDGLNILPLAKGLGGGGHAHATGVIMEGELNHTVDLVVARAERFLAQSPPADNHVEPADACK